MSNVPQFSVDDNNFHLNAMIAEMLWMHIVASDHRLLYSTQYFKMGIWNHYDSISDIRSIFFILFVLMFYIPINTFSVMSGWPVHFNK